MGMVAERPGPGDPHFPKTFKVESLVGFDFEPKHQYGADLWVPQLHVAGTRCVRYQSPNARRAATIRSHDRDNPQHGWASERSSGVHRRFSNLTG